LRSTASEFRSGATGSGSAAVTHTYLLETPPTAAVKIVLHLFILIEPEYAIVPGRCTSSAGRAARIFIPDKLPHL
jgi:hypothetical protein